MVNQAELTHLTPLAIKITLSSDNERIAHIKKDLWLGYYRATLALQKLEEVFTYPKRQRMPNLLIIGPTNNGKSMLVTKFIRSLNEDSLTNSDYESIPIIHLQMPSEPKVQRFYSLLLNAIGAPYSPRAKVSELEVLVLNLLKKVNLKMLIIDEVHNILAGTAAQQREMLNLLRFLGNSLCIPLVCIGTKDAYLAIRSDAQLENRFEPIPLPAWQYDKEYLHLLSSFEAMLPLRKPSNLQNSKTAQYILTKSEGIIGEIAKILCHAAIHAIKTKNETISYNLLKELDYQSPSERIQTFERQSL